MNAKFEMHESQAVMMGENLFHTEVECLKVEYRLYRCALTLEMKQGVPGITKIGIVCVMQHYGAFRSLPPLMHVSV